MKGIGQRQVEALVFLAKSGAFQTRKVVCLSPSAYRHLWDAMEEDDAVLGADIAPDRYGQTISCDGIGFAVGDTVELGLDIVVDKVQVVEAKADT
jgi:hypothetical protein